MSRTFELSEAEYSEMTDENGGFCIECGEAAYGVEPDARQYKCEACGKRGVYGLEELLVMGAVTFTDDD